MHHLRLLNFPNPILQLTAKLTASKILVCITDRISQRNCFHGCREFHLKRFHSEPYKDQFADYRVKYFLHPIRAFLREGSDDPQNLNKNIKFEKV